MAVIMAVGNVCADCDRGLPLTRLHEDASPDWEVGHMVGTSWVPCKGDRRWLDGKDKRRG